MGPQFVRFPSQQKSEIDRKEALFQLSFKDLAMYFEEEAASLDDVDRKIIAENLRKLSSLVEQTSPYSVDGRYIRRACHRSLSDLQNMLEEILRKNSKF